MTGQDPRERVLVPEEGRVEAVEGAEWEALDWGREAIASALSAARRCPTREACSV